MGWRWSLKRRVVRTHDTSVYVQKLCMLISRLINCHGFISNERAHRYRHVITTMFTRSNHVSNTSCPT